MQNERPSIPLSMWKLYTPEQRARIAAMHILAIRRITVREALSNTPAIADQAMTTLESDIRAYLNCQKWPVTWTKEQCDAALNTDWRQVATPIAPLFFCMNSTRKHVLIERAMAVLRECLPGIDPRTLLYR